MQRNNLVHRKKFAINFKRLLKNSKIKRQELSKCFGVAIRTFQGYSRGERVPELDTLVRIADYFNITIDELIGRIPNKKSSSQID